MNDLSTPETPADPAPVGHDPLALLAAALQTERPELLTVFVKQMKARIEFEHSLDAESSGGLIDVIANLFTEVYDLRRTVRAMQECDTHIEQAMRGVQKQLAVSREVSNRGLAGHLPPAHSLYRAIKDELETDWRLAREGRE